MTDSFISTNLQFSRADIENLANRLGSAGLKANEQKLLLAIFSAASDHVSVPPPANAPGLAKSTPAASTPAASSPAESTPAQLSQQLLNSFVPGNGDSYLLQGRIGAEPVGDGGAVVGTGLTDEGPADDGSADDGSAGAGETQPKT